MRGARRHRLRTRGPSGSLSPKSDRRKALLCRGDTQNAAGRADERNERLTLWYPDKGYKFEVRNYGGNVSGQFSEKSLVNSGIVLTPPGTIDEMARYIAGDSVSVLYEGLAPWIETSSTSGIKIQAPEWTPD